MFPHDHNRTTACPKLEKRLPLEVEVCPDHWLFVVKQSDRCVDSPSKSKPVDLTASTPSLPSHIRTTGRTSTRGIRRTGTQVTKLEVLDDSLGPLGPLGDGPESTPTPAASTASNVDHPPAPPQKEAKLAIRSQPPTISKTVTEEDESEGLPGRGPTGARAPPSVSQTWPQQAPQNQPSPRQTQRSVSVEQAAKPTFDITVGDPHKVGDLTSSHIVYQVRTKVCTSQLQGGGCR